MNISTMLLGHLIPLADEYKLNDMRQVCQKIMAVTEGYDEFVLLYDKMNTQEAIDILNTLLDKNRFTDGVEISALTHAIEHMKRWQWQPIETAPKDGTTIIIFDSYSDDKGIDGYGVCTARWDYSLKWWIMHQRYSNVISLINPTHWMPLPEPPQERKD
jgi:hypothetical protein